MGYRLLYVAKRADSRLHQFRMRTPRNVLDRARGRHLLIAFDGSDRAPAHEVRAKIGDVIKFSLGTSDDSLAKVRNTLPAVVGLNALIGGLDERPPRQYRD